MRVICIRTIHSRCGTWRHGGYGHGVCCANVMHGNHSSTHVLDTLAADARSSPHCAAEQLPACSHSGRTGWPVQCPFSEEVFVIRLSFPKTLGSACLSDRPTGPSFRNIQHFDHPLNNLAFASRRDQLFRRASLMMALSRERSATSFFSSKFSFSRCLRLFACLVSMPPYSFRQRK